MIEEITEKHLEPYISGRITSAPACGVEVLDKHLRFKRNLTIIGGVANTGKTTAWLWVLFTWAMKLGGGNGPRFLLFTNENENVEMKVMLLEWYCRCRINHLERDKLASALEFIDDHFQVLPTNYSTSLGNLLRHSSDIKRKVWDYDGLFIDPYNSLKVASYHEHYENAGAMRKFVTNHKAKLMVSMHVLSEAQRSRDKDGNIKCPHVASLENGSMWFNRADDCITIHRQTQNPERKFINEIHVQKIKHTRSGGENTDYDKPIELEFDKEYGGFTWKRAPIDFVEGLE